MAGSLGPLSLPESADRDVRVSCVFFFSASKVIMGLGKQESEKPVG